MNLIERYVKEVGRRLPRQQRDDVETELRSLLSDMVEDRAQTKLSKVDEEVIVEVLREFGAPKEVADSYQSRQQYLIGPELFPIFKLVITIVPTIFVLITAINIGLSVVDSSNPILAITQPIIRAFPDLLQGLIAIFGNVVIIFAILERVLPHEDLAEIKLGTDEDWDPRKLYELEHAKPLNKPELVLGIVFTAFALSLLNFFPEWAGFINFSEDRLIVVPIFSPSFYNGILPWVNVLWLLTIAFNVVQLRIGERTRVVRWGEIGLSLLTVVVLAVATTYQPLLAINPDVVYTGDALNFVGGLSKLLAVLNTLIRLAFPLLIGLQLFQTGKHLYDLWRTTDDTPTIGLRYTVPD